MATKIFISYAHESEELSDKILNFSNYLRSKGVDSEIDQYEESPPEGWPKWMLRQIQEATYVLVCCSKLFYERSNDFSTSSTGLGVKWETNLILQQLYSLGTHNVKFIPFFFEQNDHKHIPLPLQPYTYYQVSKEAEKNKLLDRLLGLQKDKRPPLGTIPETQEDIQPLNPKERKSLFITSIIDLDLWNDAKWSGMAFVSDVKFREPPLVCFMFEDEKIGNKIFKDLKERFGDTDTEEEIRLSFIEKIYKDKPNDYKVHFGSSWKAIVKKLDRYGIEADESLFMTTSRIHEMSPTSNPSSLIVFKNSYNRFKKYYITNLIKRNGHLMPNIENMIQKRDVYFRVKSDIVKNKDDEDIAAFSEDELKT